MPKINIPAENRPLKDSGKKWKCAEKVKITGFYLINKRALRTQKPTIQHAIDAVESNINFALKCDKPALRTALTYLQSIKIIGESKVNACAAMYDFVKYESESNCEDETRYTAKQILRDIDKFEK
jgi:hypothetical protein